MSRLVLLLAVALGCSAAPGGDDRRPNVILVVVDTLRHDFGGVESLPTIGRLRSESLVFTRAYSHAPYTGPAHASLFTCRLPKSHKVVHNGQTLDDDELTLAEMMRARGYATAGFVSLGVLMRRYGFAQGFDDYVGDFAGGRWEIPASELNDSIATWVRSSPTEPFFLFVHYSDPHEAYRAGDPKAAPGENSHRIAAEYRRLVRVADSELGRFLEILKRAGKYESSLIILTSDHGEGLGQHGWDGHVEHLYDELIHVPLMIKIPGQEPGLVDEPFSHVQLVPFLFGRLDLDSPPGCADVGHGHISQAHPPDSSHTKYSLIVGWKKTIFTQETGVVEVYDLERDPGELRNLATAEVLPPRLRLYIEGRVEERSLTEEDEEMLRSLGYL